MMNKFNRYTVVISVIQITITKITTWWLSGYLLPVGEVTGNQVTEA